MASGASFRGDPIVWLQAKAGGSASKVIDATNMVIFGGPNMACVDYAWRAFVSQFSRGESTLENASETLLVEFRNPEPPADRSLAEKDRRHRCSSRHSSMTGIRKVAVISAC